MHICEIAHLVQGHDDDSSEQGKIVPYVASARCRHDIATLSKIGWSSEDISSGLNINLSFVKSQQARVEAEDAARRRFKASFRLPDDVPGMPAVYTIYQR